MGPNLREILHSVCYHKIFLSILNDKEKLIGCELEWIGLRNMNRKLNLDITQNNTFLLSKDILAAMDPLIGMKFRMANLLQNQFGLALVSLENVVQGGICGVIKHKLIPTPLLLVTSSALTTTYRSCFGLHPLSQVLDKIRQTASFQIRDIHPSHCGHIHQIDMSKGINV
ncbi:hypothetical protein Cgig2_008416 [Carnegiea gigantea]|uniref:RNA polymerase Rpb2 domain-containing protein n=1 Tax=Carnegiea gigantea TaxID=171969 RepID=A0A9Q1K3P8_9CARY|nr:hypothetical protein Cgig2_008416 [Carnegiea gigantea]